MDATGRNYPRYTRRYLAYGDIVDLDVAGLEIPGVRQVRIGGTQGRPNTFHAQPLGKYGTSEGEPIRMRDAGISRDADGWYVAEPNYVLNWTNGRTFHLPQTEAYALIERWKATGDIVRGNLDDGQVRFENSWGHAATVTLYTASLYRA